jgi:glucose-6-phosphate isomerase
MVPESELIALQTRLMPEIERVKAAQKSGYTTPYGCLNLPADKQMRDQVKSVVSRIKELQPSTLVIVGIGGSNLGTAAVQEALLGKFNNPAYAYPGVQLGKLRRTSQKQNLKIYYADTVDADYIADILNFVEQELRDKKTVIINIVSKSGTTTETVANGQLFIALLQRYHGAQYHNYVVVTTDRDSALWRIAEQEQYTSLEIPRLVGGRYSVFSPVGLFPLGLMGIDIEQLSAGAQEIRAACMSFDSGDNPALQSAITLFAHHQQQRAIHDTFLFSVALESLGKWYRQLMGESIGKERDINGNSVHRGITPTVSLGSTDLHSVGQLYLGGPRDKVTTFITVEHTEVSAPLPHNSPLAPLVPHIQDKSLATIMAAIVSGTQKAYVKNSLPYMNILLPEISARYIGQLMHLKMYEMIYLGYLLQVDPFDQPNVESYKQETRKILAHE